MPYLWAIVHTLASKYKHLSMVCSLNELSESSHCVSCKNHRPGEGRGNPSPLREQDHTENALPDKDISLKLRVK